MSKHRPPPPSDRTTPAGGRPAAPRRPGPWSLAARIAVSLLVVWHLAAVALAPLSIAVSMSEPMSASAPDKVATPLALAVAQRPPMQWYLDGLYLNHGYHFFAPDPGAGHLIRYTLYGPSGNELESGEFPHAEQHWPRLLYHRYFMLADQCEGPVPIEAEQQRWLQRYLSAYGQELLRQHDGASVRVQRVIHYPLYLDDALAGRELTFPETYRTEIEVVERRQEADLPASEADPAAGAAHRRQEFRRDVASGWRGSTR